MGFTHLNVASAYSAHYGTNRPEPLVAAANAMGFDALAITDRDGLYGAIKHIGACIREGISPIVGANLEVFGEQSLGRITILAQGHNRGAGWATLCRIVSKAHQSTGRDKRPMIALSDLSQLISQSPSCTVLLGPQSQLADAVLHDPAAAGSLLAA